MANAWADAFEDAVRKGTAIELQLDAAKLNLDQMLNADVPADPDKVEMLNNQIAELSAQSYGINPRIQVFRSQKKEISANRMTSQGAYVLGGALIALILTILYQVVVKMGNKTR